ncbi:hypothetical protein ACIHCV_22005 [Streptomyces sp. NPDC051956]|uniref:hypothetical protein n=1 Tax=Streptomyces sp. NPDC051956 TaxID=3365677 RepID=UPI0037D98998
MPNHEMESFLAAHTCCSRPAHDLTLTVIACSAPADDRLAPHTDTDATYLSEILTPLLEQALPGDNG